jgi:hypothetical protein
LNSLHKKLHPFNAISCTIVSADKNSQLEILNILEQPGNTFKSDIQISISLNGYGDFCNLDRESKLLSINYTNFKTLDSYSYSYRLVEGSCTINLYYFGCEVNSQSSISILLKEKFSYASSISVNVSSTSSIPDSISSETVFVTAKNNSLFIGFSPTKFYFTLILILLQTWIILLKIQDIIFE